MTKFNFNVDEDTEIVLVIVSKYLEKYFNYTDDETISAINHFYSKMKKMSAEENERDFMDLNFHHEHPFSVACRIHYHSDNELQTKYGDVVTWLREINWFNVPDEAMEDYRKWIEEGGYYKSGSVT